MSLTQDEEELVQTYLADGWSLFPDEGFVRLAGPFFHKDAGSGPTFRFPARHKHHNRNGALQGGALMTFIDRALGAAARAATQTAYTATVQLNTQFVDAVQIGETVETTPVVVRVTRQLVFLTAELTVGGRPVAVASGIWKRLGQSST